MIYIWKTRAKSTRHSRNTDYRYYNDYNKFECKDALAHEKYISMLSVSLFDKRSQAVDSIVV